MKKKRKKFDMKKWEKRTKANETEEERKFRTGEITNIRPMKDGSDAVRKAEPLFSMTFTCPNCGKPYRTHPNGICPFASRRKGE